MRHFFFGSGLCLLALLAAVPAHADHPTLSFGDGQGEPIITLSASTIPKGRGGVSFSMEWQNFSQYTDEELRNLPEGTREAHSIDYLFVPSLGFAWGLLEDWSIYARMPFVHRENIREGHLDDGEREYHSNGDASGWGDLTVLNKVRLFKGKGVQAAALAGVKFPTGKTTVQIRSGSRFEAEHQPGSGSWDPLVGGAVSRRWDDWSVDANVLHTVVQKGARETDLGDSFSLNAALTRHLKGPTIGTHGHRWHAHLAWDGTLEWSMEYHEKLKVRGVKDPDTGGTVHWLSPGIRLSGGPFNLSISVGFPIAHDLNGNQHESALRLLSSVSTSF